MASGCPCIVADTGGLREVVPAASGWVCASTAATRQHLGVMIERLLIDDELRDRLVAEASEHVLRFDWDDIAARTRRHLPDQISAAPAAARKEHHGDDAELLASMMQDDFPLTLNHIRRRHAQLQQSARRS